MLDLQHLDSDQYQAVTSTHGIVTVNAGAGTGKTKTLETRTAYLLDQGRAQPREIMAVTFTNKAAKEIRERVAGAIGDDASSVRMGTFHSLSLRILRRYAERTGLESSSFTVADDDEAREVMSEALEDSGAMPPFTEPAPDPDLTKEQNKVRVKSAKKEHNATRKNLLKEAMEIIPRWKECGLHVTEAESESDMTPQKLTFVRIYQSYQRLLENKNMCDFADLILRVVHLFESDPDIADRESSRVKFMMVDEFQDTNMLQWRWLEHMSKHHNNLFVVGDLDQSLYSFRGSAPVIMERLLSRSATNVTLRTNRRCTYEILEPANLLVDLNRRPEPKQLDGQKAGSPVNLQVAPNEFGEANMIAKEIKRLVSDGVPAEEIAVLGRAKFLLKPIEKAILKAGVPYTLLGGNSLLDKEEIKDLMAYLKVAINPKNDIAFRRIGNKPTRGIGPTTLEFILETASLHEVSLDEACHLVADEKVSGPARKNTLSDISKLGSVIGQLSLSYEMGTSASVLVDMCYEDTGYIDYVNGKDDASTRAANIEFLRQYATQFETLIEFVQEIALISDAMEEGEGVRIATIHASKGLEFDHVFLPAWEEGVFPSERSIDEQPGNVDDPWTGPAIGGVDEERRVAHVALTRARTDVSVYRSMSRSGKRNRPSRFLHEAEITNGKATEKQAPDDNDFNGISFPNKPKKKSLRLSMSRKNSSSSEQSPGLA